MWARLVLRNRALRFVATNNPFYLVATCFLLYGLHQSFRSELDAANCWVLMGILGAYTVLLTVVSLVIVRRGQVWDDARTIMVILPLLFVATSVSFDGLLVSSPAAGLRMSLCGLAVAVSEALLSGLRMTFPAAFHVPYYQ